MLSTARLTLVILLLCTCLSALADTEPSIWLPPEPSPTAKDWVRLKSGEWLRGHIQLLRDDKLSFDSDELDDLEIDWEDVAEFRSPRTLTFGLLDGTIVTGTATMRGGVLKVGTIDGAKEFEARQIHAIIEGHPTERNFWSLKASANLVTRSGNTEQNDLNSLLMLRRDTTRSQLNLQYKGNYGDVDGEETVNNHRGDIDFNLFLSRRLFVTPIAVDLFTDPFQNIDLRSGALAGGGYYLIRRPKLDWYLQLGAGGQRTIYNSVEEGEDGAVTNGTLTAGTTVEADLSKNVELDFEYSLRRTLGSDETTLHHVFLLLSFDIFGDVIDFTTSITWDYNTDPKTNAEGITPERSDLTMAYGLGVDF